MWVPSYLRNSKVKSVGSIDRPLLGLEGASSDQAGQSSVVEV